MSRKTKAGFFLVGIIILGTIIGGATMVTTMLLHFLDCLGFVK